MTRKRLLPLTGLLCLVLVLLLACTSGATTPTPSPTAKTTAPSPTASPTAKPTAPAAAVSFAGKTITMIVPTTPAGGTDITARLYAKFLGNFLPGKPSIVVKNVPAGGQTVGVAYVYTAKPDGLIVLVSSESPMMSQLLSKPSATYDFLKMPTIIGTSQASVIYANPKVVAKPEDIMTAKGLVFGSGSGSTQGVIFVLARELFDFKVDKVVMAYGGSGDARRAFLSGEINLGPDTTPSYLTSLAPMVEKGQVVPLWQSGFIDANGNMVKDANLPAEILTIDELYRKIFNKPPSGTAWEATKGVVAVARTYGKIIHVPPGTPDAIVKAYRDSAEKMLADDAFKKDAAVLTGPKTHWWYGETLQKSFVRDFKMQPEHIKFLTDTLVKYGVTELE